MFYIGLHREKIKKIILSETTSHRALVFCMRHHLVDAYQVCSNYAPGTQNGPVLGSHVLHRLIFGKKCFKSLSESAVRSIIKAVWWAG